MDAALHHRCREMMRAGDNVDDDFGIGRIGNRRFENADDRRGTSTEANGFADDTGIAIERILPKVIGENRGTGGIGSVVVRAEQTAERGMQTHHIEVGSPDYARADFARFAEPDHGEPDDREIAELADGLDVGFDVYNFGHRKVGVIDADAFGALADIDDAIFVAIIERAKQDAAHDAEDGGVGSDTERESDDHRDREPFAAPQGAGGEFQVGEK